MNISNQIANWLADIGIDQVFGVTGGGSMFLNHALGSHPRVKCTWMHHEQACAMAAEGYARVTGKPALVNVTTGPGGINALNGVFGAFTDSVPMLILSGQVKRETCLDFVDQPGLRQLGDQEGPVIHMAKLITKFSAIARKPEDIFSLLPAALDAATSGRPGPAWVEIPLDIQAASCEGKFSLLNPSQPSDAQKTRAACNEIVRRLKLSHRPIILAGSGVRIGKATSELITLAEKTGIPITTAWAHDLISSEHPLFAGRPGTIGTRAGNFSLQNADFVLVIGSRLNIRQVSYNWGDFAKNAHIVQVDIDPAELEKPFVQAHHKVVSDAKAFLLCLLHMISKENLPNYSPWSGWCRGLRERFPVLGTHQKLAPKINPYAIINHIFARLRDDDIVVCGNASACIIPFQVGKLSSHQQMFSNSGAASMGFDLPAAIGAAVGDPKRRVVCFAGDGSLLMNIQELQTLRTLQAKVIIIIIANQGYLSIRQTHQNFFGSIVGATPESGVEFPDFSLVAQAFCLPGLRISSARDIEKLNDVLDGNGPIVVHIDVDPEQNFEPRIKSRMQPNGTFVTPSLDDMFPFLPEREIESIRAEAASIRSIPHKDLS